MEQLMITVEIVVLTCNCFRLGECPLGSGGWIVLWTDGWTV